MKIANLLAVVLISAVTAFGVVKAVVPEQTAHKETAFERVMRTNTLRCGYIISEPFISIDLQSGQKSGLAVDYMAAIGKEIGLSIEWTEEVGWGSYDEGLKTGRYDVMCMPLWETGPRARSAIFTKPLYDSDMSMIARAEDSRLNKINDINANNIIVATVEGDLSHSLKAQHFPLAQENALPTGTDNGLYFTNIVTKKADAGFAFKYVIDNFNKTSDKKLKVVGNEPVQAYATALSVAHGETELKFMLDSTISTLIKSGQAAAIISKYPGVSLPSSK